MTQNEILIKNQYENIESKLKYNEIAYYVIKTNFAILIN